MKKLLVSALSILVFGAAAPALAQTYYGGSYGTPSYATGCVSVPAGLGVGSSGSAVASLQTFLVSQNYPGGGSWMITGYYGQATATAVRDFQISQGLPQTGYVDSNTAAAINRVSCGGSYAAYPTYPTYPTYPSYPTYPTYPTTYPQYQCGSSSYNNYGYNYGYGYGTNCYVSIRSLSPSVADVGERVTIYGSGFSSSGNTVRFGIGIAASNVNSYDGGTRLSFTVPRYLSVFGYSSESVYETTYPVSVTNASGQMSNSIILRIDETNYEDDDRNHDEDVEIDRVTGPSSLEEGERGTWYVYLEDGDNNEYLTYSVDWDDDNDYYYDPYSSSHSSYDDSASFSHTYHDEGTYDIRFTVRNQYSDSDTITKTVKVDNDNDNDDDDDNNNEERQVSIDDMEFDPDVVHIDRGDTVMWENDDNIDHTVTSSSGPFFFASGILDPGDDYEVEFNTSGTYYYYCSLHPEMRGTIIVD